MKTTSKQLGKLPVNFCLCYRCLRCCWCSLGCDIRWQSGKLDTISEHHVLFE